MADQFLTYADSNMANQPFRVYGPHILRDPVEESYPIREEPLDGLTILDRPMDVPLELSDLIYGTWRNFADLNGTLGELHLGLDVWFHDIGELALQAPSSYVTHTTSMPYGTLTASISILGNGSKRVVYTNTIDPDWDPNSGDLAQVDGLHFPVDPVYTAVSMLHTRSGFKLEGYSLRHPVEGDQEQEISWIMENLTSNGGNSIHALNNELLRHEQAWTSIAHMEHSVSSNIALHLQFGFVALIVGLAAIGMCVSYRRQVAEGVWEQ